MNDYCLSRIMCYPLIYSGVFKVIWDFYSQSVRYMHCPGFPFLPSFSPSFSLSFLKSLITSQCMCFNPKVGSQLNSIFLLTQLSNIQAPENKNYPSNIVRTIIYHLSIWIKPHICAMLKSYFSHSEGCRFNSGKQDKVYSSFFENTIIPIHCCHLTSVLYHIYYVTWSVTFVIVYSHQLSPVNGPPTSSISVVVLGSHW